VERTREYSCGAQLDEDVLDASLGERKSNLAVGTTADENTVALDRELLDLPRRQPRLELQEAHAQRPPMMFIRAGPMMSPMMQKNTSMSGTTICTLAFAASSSARMERRVRETVAWIANASATGLPRSSA